MEEEVEGIEFLVECPNCDWEGGEDDLVMDYYEPYLSSMPIADLCPNCGNETSP